MKKLQGKMLIVDDSDINRMILAGIFDDSYEIIEAENGKVAVDIIAEHENEIVAVLLDLSMPVMSGDEVLEWLNTRGILPHLPVFVVTAEGNDENVRKCYELGAVDIIQKPVVPFFIRRRVDNVTELYESRKKLSRKVELQGNELLAKAQEINTLNLSLIETLASAIESRDEESGEHVKRIGRFTAFFLLQLNKTGKYNFSDEDISTIAEAAILHDVGKIAIPDAILKKAGPLTDEEFDIMKTHSMRGGEILQRIRGYNSYPVFHYAYDICVHHHERYNGRGYPDKLAGDEIAIWTQVVSLADVYDALTSDRIYKKAVPHEKAVEMIVNSQCGVFNPMLMEILLKYKDELPEIMRKAHLGI